MWIKLKKLLFDLNKVIVKAIILHAATIDGSFYYTKLECLYNTDYVVKITVDTFCNHASYSNWDLLNVSQDY